MAERRSALLIATEHYGDEQLRRLRAPVRDAMALRDVLADPGIGGFEVNPLTDLPSHQVREQIEDFFADRSPDEVLLVYFSCHGVTDTDGRLYFATTDTRRQRLRATAVEAAFVQDCFHSSRSRRIVLVLDCCHSGAFPAGLGSKSGGTAPIQAQLEGRGRAVLTSSDALEYAFEVDGDRIEGTGVGSAFTSALVEGLRSGQADLDGDGLISVDELYQYTYDRVRAAQPQQTPRAWIDVQGQLVIARSVRPPSVETLPAELQELLRSSLAPARLAAVGELRRLLDDPRPGTAGAARAALVQLAEDDSRAVQQAALAALGRGNEAPATATAEPAPVAAAKAGSVRAWPRIAASTARAALMAAGLLAAVFAFLQPLIYGGSGPSGWDLVTQGFGDQQAARFVAMAFLLAAVGGGLAAAIAALAEGASGTPSATRAAQVLVLCAAGALVGIPATLDGYGAMDTAYWTALIGVAVAAVPAVVEWL